MRFESPWLLLSLLLLAAAVGAWRLAERRRMRYAVRFTNVDVLSAVAPAGRSWTRLAGPLLFLLALALLLVSLARPHVERTFLREQATVILVVDTSRSMQAEDVEPTRLAAAQEAMRRFLDQVPSRLRVGLVVFAGEAQVATPPTNDHDLVRAAVDQIDTYLIFGGTAIGDALETAVRLGERVAWEDRPPPGGEIALEGPARPLAQAGEEGEEDASPVSILFLSDGAQTRGILQPLEGAELAREARIPVHTISLGTPRGTIDLGGFGLGPSGGERIPVPPDPDTLRGISDLTGGEFSEATTAEALEGAYESLGSRLGREPGESEITFLLVALAGVLVLVSAAVSAAFAPRLP
jgi:Ca-activated chloride channel family protein